MDAAFGPGSPVFHQVTGQLGDIYFQAAHIPPVAARLREWKRLQREGKSREPEHFVQQTYVALLARLIARRFLSPRRPINEAEELLEIASGDYFLRRGVGNFGEGDLFSWTVLEGRWESGLEQPMLAAIQSLSGALAPLDFTHATPGILDTLLHRAVLEQPLAPGWLAEYIVEEELGLAGDPDRSFLDADCGTGTFLCAAIGAVARAMEERGSHPLDLLFEAPGRLRGMGRDPLAVALARLNYLLALGGLLQQDHPPVLIPVYLADAAQDPPDWSFLPDDAGVYLSTAGGEFPLPFPMIDNPLMLDWLLGRLTQYMDGAQLRLHVQSEAEAVQEVLNAYYNYLTAPKLRTPVPEALTPSQAYTLLETAQSLVRLHVQGEGTHWLHLVQNHAAPAIFARDKPDLMVGVGSTVSSGIWTQNYLSPQGRSAVLMPRPDAESGSSGRRFVDLEAVLPGAALLVSGPEQRASVQFTGGPIPPGSSWAEARSGVRITGGPPPAPP